MSPPTPSIADLHAARPRSRFLQISIIVLLVLATYSLISVLVNSDAMFGLLFVRLLST